MGLWTVHPDSAVHGAWRLASNVIPAFPAPITLGGWFRRVVGTAGFEWHTAMKCGTNAYLDISTNPTGSLYWEVFNGATMAALHFRGSNLALNLGEWYFSLCRWTPNTAIRQQTISQAGVITQSEAIAAQGTISAIEWFQIGTDGAAASRFNIAEFFGLWPDPFGPDGYIPNDLLRKIAYEGPFSVPRIGRSVQFYLPCRDGTFGGGVMPVRTSLSVMNSRPMISPHPPVNWVQPNDYMVLGMM